MTTSTNPKIRDPLETFKKVLRKGSKKVMKGNPGVLFRSHVQGAVRYEGPTGRFLVTHNHSSASKGFMMMHHLDTCKLDKKFSIDKEGYNHPGGIQTVGQFLALSVETGNYDKSFILFYDLEPDQSPTPRVLNIHIERSTEGAGCVGITDAHFEGKKVYYVAVYDNDYVAVYRSNKLDEMENLEDVTEFLETGRAICQDDQRVNRGYAGMGLFTSTNNEIYLVGFRSQDKNNRTDYADLQVVEFNEDGTLQKFSNKHTVHSITTSGGLFGLGVHYRWGSGLEVLSENEIAWWATRRNYSKGLGAKLKTNVFRST